MEIARHLAEPLRLRWDLPTETNPDLLLCGLYYRTFVTDRAAAPLPEAGSPFREEEPGTASSPFAPESGESSEDHDAVATAGEGERP